MNAMAIVQPTRADLDLAKVDWAGLAEVADAEIERAINVDPDVAPLFTDDELARARRVLPPLLRLLRRDHSQL
jgi:hypothetical protein